jgi:hypothetical protein
MTQKEISLISKIVTESATEDDFFDFSNNYQHHMKLFDDNEVNEILAKFSIAVFISEYEIIFYPADNIPTYSMYPSQVKGTFDSEEGEPDYSIREIMLRGTILYNSTH